MAKQRKFLYPSSPNSFFDDMEAEVNSTKRKKARKENPEPPEKLFLQFDPNKNVGDSSKNKFHSQSLEMQKTQWKPPVKMVSHPESLKSCKNVALGNSSVEEETVSSKSRKGSSNNEHVKMIDSPIEENKCISRYSADEKVENAKTINICSSQESTIIYPAECLPSDDSHNCPIQENSKETVMEHPNSQHNQTPKDTIINSLLKEDGIIEEEFSQKFTSDAVFKLIITKPITPNETPTLCHDINVILSESQSPVTPKEKIIKYNDENEDKFHNSSEDLMEEKLDDKEEALREVLNPEIMQNNHNINLNLTQCSDKVLDTDVFEHQMFEVDPSKTCMTTNTDKSKINNESTMRNTDIFCTPESLKNNCNQTQNMKEIDVVQTDSVSEHSCPTDINVSSTYEVIRESIEDDELNCSDSSIEVVSTYIKSENKAPDIKIDNISLICLDDRADNNEFDSQKSGQEETFSSHEVHKTSEITKNDIEGDEVDTYDNNNFDSKKSGQEETIPSHEVHTTSEIRKNNVEGDEVDIYDNNNFNSQKSGQEETIPSHEVHKNSEITKNNVERDEADMCLDRDCDIQNNIAEDKNDTTTLPEVGEGEKDKSTNNEFEHLLEEEQKICEENLEMDEEYSCLMISNSQLAEIAEIEKHYFKSSESMPAKELSNLPDNNYKKSNQLRSNENQMLACSSTKTEVKCQNQICVGTQTYSGPQNSLNSSFRNVLRDISSVNWSKNMLEMKTKIRDLTAEINSLNAVLMRFRQEIWPQRHRDNQIN